MTLGLHRQRFLLVGEGNFSFSAGLCDEKDCKTHIVATCYETEDVVCRQALAKTNIQYLRDQGAEVHFGVDCAKLKEYFSPPERAFDRIYFNFPHCGRKAGVKKNRELLAKFFCSCTEVLAEKGEIHVALCQGQGGTPADRPMREWHNSWQVVSVAAEEGLILSSVHPFNMQDDCTYKCTGYRSQDKSFRLEGALNHIFTQSLPFLRPRPVICETELEGKLITFLVPEIFVDKMNRDFLDVNSEHPVRTINKRLIDDLSKSFPVQQMSSSLSLVFQDSHSSSLSDACWMVPAADRNSGSESAVNKTARCTEALSSDFPDWEGVDPTSHPSAWIVGEYFLRPSLLMSLPMILQQTDSSPGILHVLSGLVFRKGEISPHSLPIFHETVFICVVNKASADTFIQFFVKNLTSTLSTLLQTAGLNLACANDEPEPSDPNAFVTSEFQHLKPKYFLSVKPDASDAKPKGPCLGTISTSPWRQMSEDREIVCASFNLDLLAMYSCRILDWRMLWTCDDRFLRQFSGGVIMPFKSFLLYPPSYMHDISFWVPEPEKFNVIQLHTTARCVSLETVVSVQLLDRFRHPESSQTSLCYRLVYQSCDKALSRRQVAAMQMRLRTEIQRRHTSVVVR